MCHHIMLQFIIWGVCVASTIFISYISPCGRHFICIVAVWIGIAVVAITVTGLHIYCIVKKLQLPRDWVRLEVSKKKSEPIVMAVNKLIHETWQYKDRRGKDSINLNHAKISVKCVYLVHNEVLMNQYCDALSTLSTDITSDHRKISVSTSNVNSDCQVLTQTHGYAVGKVITEADPDIKMTDLNEALNEVYLFHGTQKRNLCSIVQNGFKLECAVEGMYGRSLYLADSSEKADQYTDERNYRIKRGLCMLLVRTALGRQRYVKSEERLALCSNDTCFDRNCTKHPYKYDSALAGLKARFREYMMFNMNKCYPQLIVEYNRNKCLGDNQTQCYIIGPRNEIKKLQKKSKEYENEERKNKKDEMDLNAKSCFAIQLPIEREIIEMRNGRYHITIPISD